METIGTIIASAGFVGVVAAAAWTVAFIIAARMGWRDKIMVAILIAAIASAAARMTIVPQLKEIMAKKQHHTTYHHHYDGKR